MRRATVFLIGLVCILATGTGSFADQDIAAGKDHPPDLPQRIVTAIQLNDIGEMRQFVREAPSMGGMRVGERSVLMWAATDGSIEMLTYILPNFENLNQVDSRGYTALMQALEVGNFEHAKTLREAGASTSQVGADGYYARTLAELLGHENFGDPVGPVMKAMTREEANDILLRAAETGDVTALNFALRNGASTGRARAGNGWNAMMLAAVGGHAEAFGIILEQGKRKRTLDRLSRKVKGIGVLDAIFAGGSLLRPKVLHDMLEPLSVSPHFRSDFAETKYRQLLLARPHEARTLRLFPAPFVTHPLADLSAPPEIRNASASNSWRALQTMLSSQGLYTSTVDGKPGRGTLSGLYSYVLPVLTRFSRDATEVRLGAARVKSTQSYNAWTLSKQAGLESGFFLFSDGKGVELTLNVEQNKPLDAFASLTFGRAGLWIALEGRKARVSLTEFTWNTDDRSIRVVTSMEFDHSLTRDDFVPQLQKLARAGH